MRNSIGYGWRMAVRVVGLQLAATLTLSLLLLWFGAPAAGAALAGGFAISVGNLLFAVRLFGPGVTAPRTALRSAYAAELLKWIWLGLALYLTIAVWKLPFPPLIAGVFVAQLAFWIALVAFR